MAAVGMVTSLRGAEAMVWAGADAMGRVGAGLKTRGFAEKSGDFDERPSHFDDA